VPPPSTSTGTSPPQHEAANGVTSHASRFVFERSGRVKVRVLKPSGDDIMLPSACGALLGMQPLMDDRCAAMAWTSSQGAQACHQGNIVQALRFAWDDWSTAASSVHMKELCTQDAVLEAFAVTCSLAMVHLMQAGMPHAALQVAHVMDACSSRVTPSAKLSASHLLLLVSCNTTLALASIGGGGGLREWLHPLRSSCRDVLSRMQSHQNNVSMCVAVACAHSVQGALQALHGLYAKAAASLDDALSYMRSATGHIDVALLSAHQPECSLHELLCVREVVHDSAVVTWNMCAVFSSNADPEQQQQQQQQQCYDCALSECLKFTSAAGSDPGRPMLQRICGAPHASRLHRFWREISAAVKNIE
jgi:hypothetical protein